MDKVVIVHVLGVEQVTVLLLAEVFGVNAIGPEEFLVCHAKCLPYGLCNQLGLESSQRGEMEVNRAALLMDYGALGISQAMGLHGARMAARGHFNISGDIFDCDNNHKGTTAISAWNQRCWTYSHAKGSPPQG